MDRCTATILNSTNSKVAGQGNRWPYDFRQLVYYPDDDENNEDWNDDGINEDYNDDDDEVGDYYDGEDGNKGKNGDDDAQKTDRLTHRQVEVERMIVTILEHSNSDCCPLL